MINLNNNETKYIATKCLTAFSCLNIVEIEYGIDDYAIVDFITPQKIYRSKLKIYTTTKGRTYIKKNGTRYYLDEFIRTDI